MIGILGGMGTQAGLDFSTKLAKLYRGKLDQKYPLFVLYNKSNVRLIWNNGTETRTDGREPNSLEKPKMYDFHKKRHRIMQRRSQIEL